MRRIRPPLFDEVLLEKELCERSLMHFLRFAWPHFDPSTFASNWHLEAIAEHLEAVSDGEIRRLLVNIPPRHCKTSLVAIAWPVWTWAHKPERDNPLLGAGVRFLCASYGAKKAQQDGVTARRLIASNWFQDRWGDRVQIAKDRDNQEQYDTTAGGSRISTGIPESLGKGGVIRIVDDPHKTDEVESDVVREGVIKAYDEIWRTRENDPNAGAEVIIMQRQAENDLSGHVLADGDVVHLCLPAEYDPARHCTTVIGFSDPRTEDGELLWPQRFGSDWAETQKRRVGEFAWCNPAEAPVLMADLSLKPISDVKEGDWVVGFEADCTPRRAGEAHAKRRLVRSQVKAVSVSRRPVVKVSLDSGRSIRCTADHQWYTGRSPKDGSHPVYAPAKVGRPLMRVCDPELPSLTDPDDVRLAGWLAGFFDGEGTVSVNIRRKGRPDQGTGIISFCQGSGRNGPMCKKLEKALTRFGFEWSYAVKRTESTHDLRMYWIRCNGLPVYQRFLHVVQPLKWRDRLTECAFGSNFIKSEEKVISIEPDCENEVVYGLTTTTGNYVVWGLASSNSGQYQQSPVPRGGGVIKKEWWQLWSGEDRQKYPPFEYILATVDTATSIKTEADYSACTVWGLWRDEFETPRVVWRDVAGVAHETRQGFRGAPRLMLMYAWQDRLTLHDLVLRLIETCSRFKVDRLRIEATAAGFAAHQELHRLLSDGCRCAIDLERVPQGMDKYARLVSIQHLFQEGLIYAPEKAWADMVIDQVASFPRGAHDDLVDCTSSAVRYLRDINMALRSQEHTEAETALGRHRGRASLTPLYDA